MKYTRIWPESIYLMETFIYAMSFVFPTMTVLSRYLARITATATTNIESLIMSIRKKSTATQTGSSAASVLMSPN